MTAQYLEVSQCLLVPSSENVQRPNPPRGRLHIQHSAVIEGTLVARRDAKPRTAQVEVLRTVQWPAGNRKMVEVKVQCVL